MLPFSLKKIAYSLSPSILHSYLNRIEASDLGSRLATGIFWSMSGSVISRGLMLCATIFVARILGKTGYGELGMIQSTVGMFGVFAGFGLGLTAIKHVAEFRNTDPDRAGRIVGLTYLIATCTGSLMAVGMYAAAPWLAEHTINAPHLTNILRISALILLLNAINGAQTGALSGFEAFKTIAHVNLFVGLISFPVLVLGAYIGEVTGAVWALVINLSFNWAINHLALRKEAFKHRMQFSVKNCGQELNILWHFALPATLSGIMVGPANWACRAMLSNQTDGYDEMGILTAALVFQGLLMFVGGTLSAPLLSMISSTNENIPAKLGTVNILSTWLLGVLVAIPLLTFPELPLLAFGDDYATEGFRLTFVLIVFCTTIMMYKEGLARVLAAKSLLWWGFASNTFWAVTLICCAYFLVYLGALGLAISLTIAYILNTLILVPFYSSRNLVPKGTLLSFESISIWGAVALLVVLNFANASLSLRGLCFVLSLSVVLISFRNIIRRSEDMA